MKLTLDNYEGLQFIKNIDNTYSGTKEVELFDKEMNKTIKGTVEFNRLQIDWVDDIEFGTPERIEVLRPLETDIEENNIYWKLTVPE